MSGTDSHLYSCRQGLSSPHPGFGARGELGECEGSMDLAGYVMEGGEEFLTDLLCKQERLKEAPAYLGQAYCYPGNLQLAYCPQALPKAGTRPGYPAPPPPPGGVKEEPGEQGRSAPHYQPLHYQAAHCGQTSMQLGPAPINPGAPHRMYKAGGPGGPGGVYPMGPRAGARGKKAVNRDSMEYRLRRERNNMAVRKSRDKAKRRNLETQRRAADFLADNERLRARVEQLSHELDTLRGIFRQLPEGPGSLPHPHPQ